MQNYLKAILILSSLTFTNVTSAQLYFGVKGGLNISNISGSSLYTSTYNKFGYNVSAFAEYDFSKNFSLTSEAGYSRKGFDIKYNMYDINLNYLGNERLHANIDYIDISLLPKFKFPVTGFILYGVVGPFLGIKTGNSVVLFHTEYDPIYGLDFLLTNFKSPTFGIKMGIGGELRLTKRNSILLEVRYVRDLISSYDEPSFHPGVESWAYSDDVQNRLVEIVVGAKF